MGHRAESVSAVQALGGGVTTQELLLQKVVVAALAGLRGGGS